MATEPHITGKILPSFLLFSVPRRGSHGSFELTRTDLSSHLVVSMCPCLHQLFGKLQLEGHTFEGSVSSVGRSPIGKEKKRQAKEKEKHQFSWWEEGQSWNRAENDP